MNLPNFLRETTAHADEVASNAQPSLFESLVPILLILVLMYFVMIRPQVKKAKDHNELLKNLKIGDEVVTSGGIIGRIRSMADAFVTIDIGSTQMKVLKEHVNQLVKVQAQQANGQEKTTKDK
jgi:preprotein translocase subunit YajC